MFTPYSVILKSISNTSTVFLEKRMSRMLNVFIPALLVSALALSACATKQEAVPAPVAAPAPAEVVAEKPAEVAAEPAPAAAAATMAEQPQASAPAAPKKKALKAKRVAAKPAPQATPPAPAPAPVIEEPAPVAAPAVVVAPEPAPPVAVAPPPAKEIAETGLLEQYWMWLLGLLIVIAGIVVWWRKNQVAE